MNRYLYLFAIGPVQPFIASARRLQDLYVGSRILTHLAREGVRIAHNQKAQMLFPAISDANEIPRHVSHRFAFLLEGDENQVATVADTITQGIHEYWKTQIAAPVQHYLADRLTDTSWMPTFERQQSNWLEVNWVAVAYNGENYGATYATANAALAQRKLARQFPPAYEPGTKCTLSGAQSALFPTAAHWQSLRTKLNSEIILRPNENLGTLAAIKRFALLADTAIKRERVHDKKDAAVFPSALAVSRGLAQGSGKEAEAEDANDEEGRYISVIKLDGDNMGTILSRFEAPDQHQTFSRTLSTFADNVQKIVQEHHGYLIYAGGDDVLALTPIDKALACANALQFDFKTKMTSPLQAIFASFTSKDTVPPRISASAGIAIAQYKNPLDLSLAAANRAEERAKEHYHRNAVAIIDSRGSIRETGGQWESLFTHGNADEGVIAELIGYFSKKPATLSSSIGYDTLQMARIFNFPSPVPSDAAKAEFGRLLARRLGNHVPKEERHEILRVLPEQLLALAHTQQENKSTEDDTKLHAVYQWETLANWLILARFLAQQKES